MNSGQPIQNKSKLEQMKKILESSSKRDALLFALSINSGLKVSEILQLKIKDILDDQKNIRHSISFYNEQTKKQKWFAVNKELEQALSAYLQERKYAKGDEPLLKSQKGSGPITRQHAWYVLNKAAKEAGLDGISSHTLRKTWGYQVYQSGVDIAFLQHFFSHSTPFITLKYIGVA